MTGPAIHIPILGDSDAVPASATVLVVVEIDMRLAAELNRLWHSLLPRTDLGNLLCGNTSAAYGAEFDNMLWAVAIFSQPIAPGMMDGKTIELRRLAICDQAPKNTASRMLAVCRKLVVRKYPQMRRLVSYQALDHHAGTIYRASGWKPVGKVSKCRPQRNKGSRYRATGPLQTHSPKQRWEIAL